MSLSLSSDSEASSSDPEESSSDPDGSTKSCFSGVISLIDLQYRGLPKNFVLQSLKQD